MQSTQIVGTKGCPRLPAPPTIFRWIFQNPTTPLQPSATAFMHRQHFIFLLDARCWRQFLRWKKTDEGGFSREICAGKFTQLLKNYAGFSSSSSRLGFRFRTVLPAAGKHGPNLPTPVQEPGIIQFMKLKVWQGRWVKNAASCLRKFGVNLIFK